MEYARKSVKKEDLDRYERFAREMKMGGKKETGGTQVEFKWPTLEEKKKKKRKKKFLIQIYMEKINI